MSPRRYLLNPGTGGQRARVALARALYSDAPLLLLDDIFSSLDVKTAVLLWNNVFCSKLLEGRTVILVTQTSWIPLECDLVVTLENGQAKCSTNKIVRRPKPFEKTSKDDIADVLNASNHKLDDSDSDSDSESEDEDSSSESIAPSRFQCASHTFAIYFLLIKY
jgi:ABC-type nitrate/sulfonate/bicarbonate transport system ATPase subunit